MKMFREHRTAFLFVVSLILATALFSAHPWRGVAQSLQESLLPLMPGVRERNITMGFITLLEKNHISQRTVDRTLSKEAFRLYIKSLDPRKVFFYQSDIDEFKSKYEMQFCEFVKQKPVDLRPAFEIYNRYLTRLKERVDVVQQILATPMDFTADEEYVIDNLKDFTLDENIIREKGLLSFPKNEEEAYERWRKRLKSELLGLRFEAITSQQKREKALAEGKEPVEVDERDPVERLQKRYISFQKRMLLEVHTENRDSLNSIRLQANDEVMELLLNAIAGSLDPHSSYLNPATEEAFNTGMSKNFQGIGATLTSEDGYIVVKEVIKGSPAEKTGIRINDKIQGVGQGQDGSIEEVINFKVSDVVKRIRGPKETIVRLDILPGGKEPSKIVEIVRATILLDDKAAQETIFEAGQKADGTPYKIGFIVLPDFYHDMNAQRMREEDVKSATTDIKRMLKKFVEANVDAVVLDLRFNGGGALLDAIEITGLFTGAGTVVQVKDDANARPTPRGSNDVSCDWTGPLVVVTNKLSASASEIFAGAIKDYKRGLIVGDSTTHGKGSVQTLLYVIPPPLGGKSEFGSGKITIQGYYHPSGISPQRTGVESDIVLPSRYDALEGIMESDLDNALTFRKVEPAVNFSPKQYVTPQMITELKRRSENRVINNEEFAKEQDKILAAKEVRTKRVTPLNEEKYVAEELKRFDSDEEEIEDSLTKGKEIERDFYVEEVLALTVDYVKITQELGVTFPKERTVQPPARKGFFFGF